MGNPKTFPSLSAPSPHHNESINLALKNIKSLYNVQAKEVLTQLKCIEDSNDIKLKPIKELFFQSNPTLIPMEYFDVKLYIDAHINANAYKFFDIIQYCNANFIQRHSTNSSNDVFDVTPTTANGNGNKSNLPKTDLIQNRSDSFKSFNIMKANSFKARGLKMRMQSNDEDDDELDEADIDINIPMTKLDSDKDDGFKMLDAMDSEPLRVSQTFEANVDQSGMVYLFDYQEQVVEDFERLQLIATMSRSLSRGRYLNLSGTQESINSVKSDSNLPYGGKFRGGTSDSSVLMFE